MNITAPFDSIKEIKWLIDAGASKLYCGVFSRYRWKNRVFPNARIMASCHLGSFQELKDSLKITKKYHIPVFLCVNNYLGKGAFESLFKDVSLAVKLGVDGFIIADFDFIPFIRELDKSSKIILSCFNACFNSKALEFFSELGVNRIILDRQLTLEEIKDLSKTAEKNKIELEVFINNISCRHVNANCLYHKMARFAPTPLARNWLRSIMVNHRNIFIKSLYTAPFSLYPCTEEYSLEIFKKESMGFVKKNKLEHFSLDADLLRYCAVCSIYFLEKYGVASVKIIGRGFFAQKKIKDVKFARRYLDELKDGFITEHNFLSRGKSLYREIYGRDCVNKQCHHWEVYQQRQKLKDTL